MTPTETTTILRQFNEWRLGDDDLPQPDAVRLIDGLAVRPMNARFLRRET